jgi:hypothetical protein
MLVEAMENIQLNRYSDDSDFDRFRYLLRFLRSRALVWQNFELE